MNLLLLAIALRAWSGSALSAYLRLMAAIAVFSLEMQVVTWSHLGSIRSLRLVNLVLAALGILWHARRRARLARADTDDALANRSGEASPASVVPFPPFPAVAVFALLIATLALLRPVIGADPYHLHRVDLITGTGTLAYDPGALDIKINALAGVYELLLADLRIPAMATAFVRLHGLFGFALYVLTIAVVAPWVSVRRRWLLLIFLVVPVVFHQLVLVKNDLFGALPAFVALAWVVTRGPDMSPRETLAAGALAGFAAGIKISSTPIAVIVVGWMVWDHRHAWSKPVLALLGVFVGAAAGGLLFALVENSLVYGAALQPYVSLGNRHERIGDALTGIVRFTISLFDLGLLTPRVWPGRGGWGSTLGLPLIWSLASMAVRWREPVVRRASATAAAAFLAFAASYPDADIAHRMVIGPGLLLILIGIRCAEGEDRRAVMLRRALVFVLIASAAQIARSAVLYLRA